MNLDRNDGIQARTRGVMMLALVALMAVACGSDERARNADEPAGADAAAARDREVMAELDVYAEAVINAIDDSGVSGIVRFDQRGSFLEISGQLAGLSPGAHGLHVHENGDCSGEGASNAGGHLSPEGHPHGSPELPDAEHHAGDLGNVEAGEDGTADFQLADGELQLGSGSYAVNGLAIVVHAGADDLQTQPDGNAGPAVGCGIVDPVPQPDYVPEGE